jgi:hypothetical protein
MRTDIIRCALLGILLLGLTSPDIALAGDSEKGCSNIGTWFGVAAPGDTRLTGWSVNAIGKSEKMGTNIIDFPTFDPKLEPDFAGVEPFMYAERIDTLRGDWKRVGKDRFEYTLHGSCL